jgi:hypothetical protein
MLAKVKLALRIVTNAFDSELNALIDAAKLDLGIAGVTLPDNLDAICELAIITYCKCHFGEPDDYDRLKASYDEQKAQLSMATGYTTWTDQTP